MQGQAPHQEKSEWLLMNAKQRERKVLYHRVFSQHPLTFMSLTGDSDMLTHLDPSFLILTYSVTYFKYAMKVTSLIKLYKMKKGGYAEKYRQEMSSVPKSNFFRNHYSHEPLTTLWSKTDLI